MRRRIASAAAALSFVVLLALVIWQGSFKIEYSPSDLSETVVLWAVSTVIFLLTVTLAFMLFRALVKVYIDRQRNREGSRIRSKLLAGALVLTLTPTLFYVVFSVYVLNRHLDAWFRRPAKTMQISLKHLEAAYRAEAQERLQAETNWIGLLPRTRDAAISGRIDTPFFEGLAQQHGIRRILLTRASGSQLILYENLVASPPNTLLSAATDLKIPVETAGTLTVYAGLDADRSIWETAQTQVSRYAETEGNRRKLYQDTYFRLISLITLFVLFFASWAAQILSRQISIPISALLGAAGEVRRGNLAYRVRVDAIDELASLVRAFNAMTSDLESNARELEVRRSFTEAILESIPTGVISVSPNERIERVNRALSGIFPANTLQNATHLSDLFPPEDLTEIRYLINRARRTGAAGSQLEIQHANSTMQVAVTVAALDQQRGLVLVLEDTSELLRGQKAAAWQEVAKRIAHEIKNPLTPISLCADRMDRQLSRLHMEQGACTLSADAYAIFAECTATIQQEVQTVKSLVDEFSQFSRFPAAHPIPADLNEIVESAMAVFAGRLHNIGITLNLEQALPLVLADKEQIKRVLINLIDNAAESMQNTPVRQLRVETGRLGPETVELSVTDTGSGVSSGDKEKLFLPYFSTKSRGTGLGLAIVNRIIAEHKGRVRVEDNTPAGTRFVIELNVVAAAPLRALVEQTQELPATLEA